MIRPKITVVVPVYNVEKYLERCLESIVNQTFKDIEIIAINDGSTDNSLDLLKKYEDKDNRIRIINNRNIGVSQSRNIGIKEAKGEFIVFVDSDDWIDLNMIETMYNLIENNDLVMCTYTREFSNHSKEKVFNLPELNIYEGKEVKSELLRKLIGPLELELSNPEYLDALGTVWAKLYRKNILVDNQIEFVDLDLIGSGEDTLFNIYALNKIKRVILINKPMYHYWRDNPKSITSRYIPNFKEKRKLYFKYMKDFIKENNLGAEYNRALDNRICTSVLGMGLIECSKDKKISTLNKITNIKAILKEDYINSAYENLQLKYFSAHWRVFYFFNKHKLAFLSYFMINVIEFLRKTI